MTNDTMNDGIDRRTVLRAGAWGAPVILAAVAAPAAAASTGTIEVLAWEWDRRRNAGWIRYRFDGTGTPLPVITFNDPDMDTIDDQPLGNNTWVSTFESESVFSEPPVAFAITIQAAGYPPVSEPIVSFGEPD
jgi:hypothetical protein